MGYKSYYILHNLVKATSILVNKEISWPNFKNSHFKILSFSKQDTVVTYFNPGGQLTHSSEALERIGSTKIRKLEIKINH